MLHANTGGGIVDRTHGELQTVLSFCFTGHVLALITMPSRDSSSRNHSRFYFPPGNCRRLSFLVGRVLPYYERASTAVKGFCVSSSSKAGSPVRGLCLSSASKAEAALYGACVSSPSTAYSTE